jgi:hypothetical protein
MFLHKSILAALIALTAAAIPVGSFAQSEAAAAPPTYGRATDESVKGRVESFDGAYSLLVRDDRGFIDNVRLHPGTIINPTGIRLSPGMSVTVYGVNRGPEFAANEIDTPYDTYGAAYPVYSPYGYGYPYPYGYPYGYPFSFGIRIGGGFHEGFHGGGHRGFR